MLENFVEFSEIEDIKMFFASNPPFCTAVRATGSNSHGDVLNLFTGPADYSQGRRDCFIGYENVLGFRIDEKGDQPLLYLDKKGAQRLVGKIKDLEQARKWVRKANEYYPYQEGALAHKT